MQDNAAPYRSAYSMKWLKNNHINMLKWSPISPDLDPMGSPWDYIDRKLQKMKLKNIDELQQMIEYIWCGVTSMLCQRLVDSMPDHIKQCVKFRGGTFKRY